MSRLLWFDYDILLEFNVPVGSHAFVLRCIPPSFPGQEILDVTLMLEPRVDYALQHDGFGNLLQVGQLKDPHDRFHYRVHGCARTDLAGRRPEPAHPVFRFPSAFTALSPEMDQFLARLTLTGTPAEQAWQICAAVGKHMTYLSGSTDVATTASQAFAAGAGVCQDFAHIYLALARGAGLTARYVNGLPEGEGASHAWCEVWLDGLWVGIDPTRSRWTDESYIRFNVGRDFGDCPMERGVFFGKTDQRQTVFMRVGQQDQAEENRNGAESKVFPAGKDFFRARI